jgi:hypothetical protein
MCATLLAGASTAFIAKAADITVLPAKKAGDDPIIVIAGSIAAGDDVRFRDIAAKYSRAVVALDSPGGMILPAMDIGRTIKLRGYSTAVVADDRCVSACALIWVAGSRRMMFEGAQVGFHASYLDNDGTKLETGVGNALVGHYLSQLGFSQTAVIFATLAPPDKVFWLNAESAPQSGINYDRIPSNRTDATPQRRVTPPPVTTVVTPRPAPIAATANDRWMGDAKRTMRSPEAFALALRQKGYQAKVDYEDKASPTMLTGVGGQEIVVSFSGCDNTGCDYIQLLDIYKDISRTDAQRLSNYLLANEQYSHPHYTPSTEKLALYSYIVIGQDGITLQVLIDNMKYFVKDNAELTDLIVKWREKG